MSLLSQLLHVPAADPGDARRRRLLNILLVGIAALTLLLILVTAIASTTGVLERQYTELTAFIHRVLDEREKGTRNRILVVDDEADIVGWLKHSLSHSGYRVAEAYDGIQALEAVAADKPDLILLDMKMPRMDGRTALRRLRAEEESRDIPVIVLSANAVADDAERRQLMDLGVRGFLNKPVTMEQLIAEIRKHLEAS